MRQHTLLLKTNVDTYIRTPQFRTISWYVCLGEEVNNICISQKLMMGVLASHQWQVRRNISHRMPFYPNGLNETITVIYQFDEFDLNPSDDVLISR